MPTATGVTPGTRAAWPRVAGTDLAELLPHLVRQAGEPPVIEVGRERRVFVVPRPLDLFLRPLDISGVAGTDLEGRTELRGDALRRPALDLHLGRPDEFEQIGMEDARAGAAAPSPSGRAPAPRRPAPAGASRPRVRMGR